MQTFILKLAKLTIQVLHIFIVIYRSYIETIMKHNLIQKLCMHVHFEIFRYKLRYMLLCVDPNIKTFLYYDIFK